MKQLLACILLFALLLSLCGCLRAETTETTETETEESAASYLELTEAETASGVSVLDAMGGIYAEDTNTVTLENGMIVRLGNTGGYVDTEERLMSDLEILLYRHTACSIASEMLWRYDICAAQSPDPLFVDTALSN